MKDVVIIGAGPGGFDTAVYAKKHGLDVVLIEQKTVGGTCLNWGCIPTKALYHNACHMDQLSELSTFGISIHDHTIDFDAIKARKEQIVANQIGHIHTTIKKKDITFLLGEARILDSTHVQVADQVIETKNIIIATGSKPRTFPFDGSDLPVVHDSKSLLTLETWPRNMIVVGAGVIGSEMASIFHAFGANVTLIEYMDQILPSQDIDIQKRARNLFKRRGIDIHTNSSLLRVEQDENQYVAVVQTRKGDIHIPTDYILLATGRQPYIGNLPLDSLGIQYTSQGIKVNKYKQTTIPNIYAIGDVNGELMLAHKATYDGYKAISHICQTDMPINFDLVPSVTFSIPEIASVGVVEQALEAGSYQTQKALYKSNAKAECMNETDGFIKLIVTQTEEIIGCHIIGTHASDLIHEVAGLMYDGITVSDYRNRIHAHPTLSEIIGHCLQEL
jgi:dihydrolipoamide dehydrogenase